LPCHAEFNVHRQRLDVANKAKCEGEGKISELNVEISELK
jgi:hypothetical protein